MSLRALLLDVDGTLADTEDHGHRPAYNRAFRKLGLDFRWGPKLYRKLLQQPGGRERLRYYVQRYQPDGVPPGPNDDPALGAWVDRAHKLKSKYFREYLREGRVPLRPGVARLIREAHRQGLRVALVSNASRASLGSLLRYGVDPTLVARIDLIVSGEDVARKKPAPDGYLFALTRLGLRADECVAIEDSAMGLAAASAAGIRTVVSFNRNTEGEDFAAAVLVLDHLGEPDRPAEVRRGELPAAHLRIEDLRRLCGE